MKLAERIEGIEKAIELAKDQIADTACQDEMESFLKYKAPTKLEYLYQALTCVDDLVVRITERFCEMIEAVDKETGELGCACVHCRQLDCDYFKKRKK